MHFKFHNDFHGTTAAVTVRNWQISQRQVRRVWIELCGEIDCEICNYGGLRGNNKYQLRKLGGNVCNDGAEIYIKQ